MTHNSEIICDDNGFELLVGYDFEKNPSQIEEGHGFHETGLMIYTELKSVELIIAGIGIDVLDVLNEKQKEFITQKLSYE